MEFEVALRLELFEVKLVWFAEEVEFVLELVEFVLEVFVVEFELLFVVFDREVAFNSVKFTNFLSKSTWGIRLINNRSSAEYFC